MGDARVCGEFHHLYVRIFAPQVELAGSFVTLLAAGFGNTDSAPSISMWLPLIPQQLASCPYIFRRRTVVLQILLPRQWLSVSRCGSVLESVRWLKLKIQTLVHMFLPFFLESMALNL